jgi:hypothetical protein
MQRANLIDIRKEINIEEVCWSETLVKRTNIHIVIFLKTVLFRADWIRNMIANIKSRILCADKKVWIEI